MGLDEVRVRLDRAKEHLDALNAELDRFAATKPYALHVVTYYGNNIRDVEWLRDPPLRWSAIVSDFLHDVRGALDHIVYELSGGDGTGVPKYVEWPIFIDETEFFRRSKNGRGVWGSGLRKIERITNPNAGTAIRKLQPFRGPDPLRHPLWVLHELNNFDKHRAFHVMLGWAYTHLSERGIFDIPDLPRGWRQAKATQSPMYVAELPTGPVGSNVSVRGDLAIHVSLPPETVGSHQPLDVVLTDILSFVATEVVGGELGKLIPLYRGD